MNASAPAKGGAAIHASGWIVAPIAPMIASEIMAAIGPNLFIRQPDEYPSGYYPASGLHYLAILGTELAVREDEGRFFQRHGVFWELVSFDQYLDAFFQNPDLSLLDAMASAVGYRASF